MPHRKLDAGTAQALQPGAQQRRGLHVPGKHPARAADKSLHAQRQCPGTQLGRPESGQQRLQLRTAITVAAEERPGGFGMGQVQPALAGQQKLAARRGHGVKNLDRQVCPRAGQHLGRHQAGRATADDGDM